MSLISAGSISLDSAFNACFMVMFALLNNCFFLSIVIHTLQYGTVTFFIQTFFIRDKVYT